MRRVRPAGTLRIRQMTKVRDTSRDFDFIVIGSGFGGSVAAHRLTEKGYRVAVMEMGRRWTPRICRARVGRCGVGSGGRIYGSAGFSIFALSGT